MALPIQNTWEVRSATGSDTNGGGVIVNFTGTDYSQQGSKNTTGSNISVTNAVAAGTTTITSATAAFTTAINGNIIYLQGGSGSLAAGWYVATYVSALSITVDRNVATGTGITMNIGGALATVSQAVTNAQQNDTIWFKGSQTITSTISLALSYNGSNATPWNPFSIIGYSSTRGDGGQATITCATNSVNGFTYNGGQVILENLIISCTAGTPGYGIIAGTSTWYFDLCLINCRVTAWSENIRSPYSTQIAILPITLINCQIDSAVSHGIETVSQIAIIDSYIHGNGGNGLYMNTAGGQVAPGIFCQGSVFYNNATDGIHHLTTVNNQYSTCGVWVINCAFANNTNGYNFASGTAASINIINCIFDTNTNGMGGSTTQTIVGVQFNNAFWNNTHNRANFPTGVGDVSLSGTPFTNKSGGDFTLNATTGAGAACKAAGYQSTII